MVWYSDGTMALTNGSPNVVLTGGSYVAAGIVAGDALVAQGARVEIASITDATNLVLALPWAGSTDGAATYHIEPIGAGHNSTGRLVEKLQEHIDLLKLRDRNAVLSRSLTLSPGSPGIGDRYIVASGATGGWQDQDDNYAEWSGSRWVFLSPGDIFGGVWCWVEDEQYPYVYTNSGWAKLPGQEGTPGEDGEPGIDGEDGDPGEDGEDGASGVWGGITGTLSTQADLQEALNGKLSSAVSATNIILGRGSSGAGPVEEIICIAGGRLLIGDPGSDANGKGASLIGVEDAAGNYTTNKVESVLAELAVLAARETFIISCSDEITDIEVGTGVTRFEIPFSMELTGIIGTVTTAPTGSSIVVDVNDGGATIMTTDKIVIDATETSSNDAATSPTLTDTTLVAGSIITFDIDQVGSTTAGTGLKIYLIGHRI